jgi:RNA-splicing ligase RtcB
MLKVEGIHNTAICYTDAIEPSAIAQIKAVCDRKEFEGSSIRIMPDVHTGMGCTIGTTMTISDKVVPGMVGVDIGCGMETIRLKETEIDYRFLDEVIRHEIPSGFDVRQDFHELNDAIELQQLRCARRVNLNRGRLSIGSLGGGNHFIEIDRSDKSGELFLVVHSGSRHIGNEVAEYYQDQAYKAHFGNSREQIQQTIAKLKAQGNTSEIEQTIKQIKQSANFGAENIPKDLAYVSGELFDDYCHDMKMIQRYAVLNRQAMVEIILRAVGLTEVDRFTTIHNYIDLDKMILRKGAVSAEMGEKILIPINMRDGSLICIGKGNDDWNRSAPHGAGRIMSRKAAFASLSMTQFVSEMEGIYTTSVNKKTLDESPMAYKTMEEIVYNITPTAEIVDRVRPTYNFKAAEEKKWYIRSR